jgi:hypothetical protein
MPQEATNSIRIQISETRRISDRDMRAHERREKVTLQVIEDLKKTGVFFKTREGYFYFEKGEAPRLFPIDAGSVALAALIQERFGISAAERREYDHVISGLRNEAHVRGQQVEIHRLAHYDPESGRLYVSRFNGWVYCLNGKSIRQVLNGTNDVFFWDDPTWQSYELVRNKRPGGRLDSLIAGSANFTEADGLSPADQRWIFSVWLHSQFFESLHPTKPMVLVCGEKGSGKTLSLRKWLKLVLGRDAEVTALERTKPDGFIAAISSLPIAVFDNVDEDISWLPDHLAQLATGVSFKRRKYYTTNESVEFKPHCYVALTSRTPKFIDGRDDVLDRTLVLQTERRAQFSPEQAQLQAIANTRNLLWTELLRNLNRLLRFLRPSRGSSNQSCFRMADFADFALSFGAAEGEPNKAFRILQCLEARRAEALFSDEPVSECLDKWLSDAEKHGIEVTSGKLHEELAPIAEQLGITWPYRSGHGLGQRLSHITTNLRERFRVEVGLDSANQRTYRFWPKPESLNPAESKSE